MAFAYKRVLNQWLLSLLHVKRFKELAEHLQREDLEGLDENNVHRFHLELSKQFTELPALPLSQLLEYDQNIVQHTLQLNERRIARGDEPIVWKYFQYLALLFTELYLDRYFRDAPALLKSINAQIEAYNADKPEADQIASLDESSDAGSQLNKLAFWMATGSGKTLEMHGNGKRKSLRDMSPTTVRQEIRQRVAASGNPSLTGVCCSTWTARCPTRSSPRSSRPSSSAAARLRLTSGLLCVRVNFAAVGRPASKLPAFPFGSTKRRGEK